MAEVAAAQEVLSHTLDSLRDSSSVAEILSGNPSEQTDCFIEPPVIMWDSELLRDTLSAVSPVVFPPLRTDGTIGYFPDYYYGAGVWNLHDGFNANLNMSVCASFGKNRFPGVGFGTGISAMYAHRLTDRLMMAVGGFYDRMSWSGFNENRIGVNLMLGYQLTERVSVYAYGSKAFVPSGSSHFRLPVLWRDSYRERFGGMIHVKVNEAVSFSVSVEERRW